MTIDPAIALGAAAAPVRRAGGPRRLLVAGAIGRLGEALLEEALGRGGFDEVVALVDGATTMSLGIRGLSLATLDALPSLEAACIAQVDDPLAPGARSFHGRDAPFAPVDAAAFPPVAEAAAAAGARRLVAIRPMPAWQQLSGVSLGLSGEAELALSRLPFESVTVMRPATAQSADGRGWIERVATVYMSLQFLMAPRSMPTLTSTQVAEAAVSLARDETPGLRVLGAAAVAERLGPLSRRR